LVQKSKKKTNKQTKNTQEREKPKFDHIVNKSLHWSTEDGRSCIMAHIWVCKAKILSLTFGECHLQSRVPALWLYTHVLTRINYAWKHCWKWLSESPLSTIVTVSECLQIIQYDALWTRFLVYETAKVHMGLNQSSTVDILTSIFLFGPKSFYRQWYVRLRTVKIKNPLSSQKLSSLTNVFP
jgi:hypothetical protein